MSHVGKLSRDVIATLLATSGDQSVEVLMSQGGLCEPPSFLRKIDEKYEKFSMDGCDVVWDAK